MTPHGLLQIALFAAVIGISAWPLGVYMARIYNGDIPRPLAWLRPLERGVYRLCRIDETREMDWRGYAASLLAFSFLGIAVVYGLQRLQGWLPLNPESLGGVAPDSAMNTAVSFGTNTNWQGYSGETSLSYLTQMLGLTVQNFVSAAAGMAVLIALTRGFVRQSTPHVGNVWVDLVRGVLYILFPLSLVLAILLASQGVVQTFAPYREVALLEPLSGPDGEIHATQRIALGPVASQVAIKQLGTNGGGYFGVNSAHPLENPTPFSNFLELVAILLIPAALCVTFGQMVRDTRQGWALLTAMTIVFVALLALAVVAEGRGNPVLATLGVDQAGAGNMEGKDTRFGSDLSALWAVATTAASNGSVNSMHDSFTPLGGLAAMWLIQLGEVIFGGVGSGLYGLLAFVLVAVFLAGLMVGRTPEYLGKKIGAFEMKMASLVILLPSMMVLVGTAIAVSSPYGRIAVANPGPHGFSEVLYALSSASNNNGSAFAGLAANTPFYNGLLALAMLVGRFGVILPILGIAGSLAGKKTVPAGPGTLPTHTPLFVSLLIAVVVVVGALSFFPALALGPIVEQLMMTAQGGV